VNPIQVHAVFSVLTASSAMSRFPVVVQFEFGRRSGWQNDCDQNPPRDWKVFTIPPRPLRTLRWGKYVMMFVYDAEGISGKSYARKIRTRTSCKITISG
jgi:hypothetical protein